MRISTNVISFICQVIEEDERNKAAQTLLTDESITRTLWERLFQAQASILRGDKDCPVGKGSDPVCKWLYAWWCASSKSSPVRFLVLRHLPSFLWSYLFCAAHGKVLAGFIINLLRPML